MKKRVLVLVAKADPRRGAWVGLLAQLLGEGYEVDLGLFEDVTFSIKTGDVVAKLNDKNISDFDLVYFLRTAGRYYLIAAGIAQVLSAAGKPFVDPSFKDVGPFGSKLNTLIKLAIEGLPVIPTVFIQRPKIEKQVRGIIDNFGFPFFVKDLYLQRREGIYVARGKQDLAGLFEWSGSRRGVMFQQAISVGKEYRLVVIGGKVAAAHEEEMRVIENNRIVVHEGPTAGGFVDIGSVPKELVTLAEKAAQILNLDVAGVDICHARDGRVYIFEVNRGPGLTLNPEVSPEMPELAKFIAKKISG